MAKVLRLTAEGTQEVEVPDDELGVSAAASAVASDNGAHPQSSEKRKFFDRFGKTDAVVVREVEVDAGGEMLAFHIKEHSAGDIAKIDARRYRVGRDGQIKRDPAREAIVGMMWEIYSSVVENRGTAEKPDWQPKFKLEELDAVLNGSNPAANEFLNVLIGHVWQVNPALNPLKKMQAEQMLTEL